MRLIDADKGLISKIQRKTGCNFMTAYEIVESMDTVDAIPKSYLDFIFSRIKNFIDCQYEDSLEYEGEKSESNFTHKKFSD